MTAPRSQFMQLVDALRAHVERVHGKKINRLVFVFEPEREGEPDAWRVSTGCGEPNDDFTDGKGEGALRRACEYYETQPSKGA